MSEIYLAIDGDDVGHRLEYLMLMNNRQELAEFSTSFKSTMNWLKERLVHDFNATIIFGGGDNLLAVFPSEEPTIEALKVIGVKFAELARCTLSMGLGENPRQAYFALKLAKTSGKNRIRQFGELANG